MSSMFGMADGDPTSGLWNWAVAARIDADRVRGAIAGTLEKNVVTLGDDGEVFCDVYPVGGDFPTLVDVYLARLAEPDVPVVRKSLSEGLYILMDENLGGGVSLQKNIKELPEAIRRTPR